MLWFHHSVVEGNRLSLEVGDEVEFGFESAKQDSFDYRATWVRRV